MQILLDQLDALQREHLALIDDEMTAAVKGAQSRWQASPRVAGPDAEDEEHLTRAGEHQQKVIESIEEVLSRLRQWDDYRRFQRDVAQLVRDQDEIARGAIGLARQALGSDWKDFTPQEAADLKALVERQFELALRENRIEQEMEQTIALLRPGEPLAADTLGDALAEARRRAIAAAMLGAAGKLRDNGLAQTPAALQQVLQDLQAVLDILTNNRSQESQRLARELGASAQDLEGLRKRQEGLRRKFDEVAAATDATGRANDKQKNEIQELARGQEDLRKETLCMARRLERLLADEPARSAKQAADEMAQSSREAASGSPSAASGHAKQAERQLADIVRRLESKLADLAVQQAVEQQARLEDAVKHLHRQEERIEAETREFAALERAGSLSRAQIFGLLELARQQALLRDEAQRLARSLGEISAFRPGLSAAGDEMQRAAGLLQEQQTGSATQQAEQAAISRLALLLAAFEPESKDNAAPNDNSGRNQGGGPKPAAGPPGITMLAEIKFLKLWQEDINRRMQQLELDSARRSAEELRERYTQLAEEQAQLSAAALQFCKPQPTDADSPRDDAEKKEGNHDEIEK